MTKPRTTTVVRTTCMPTRAEAERLMQLVLQFKSKKILVVGDGMLDRYIYGLTSRLSPEAPVPVVNQTSTSIIAGGAGNVACNISALGADCMLVSLVGDDDRSEILRNILEGVGVATRFVKDKQRKTTQKTRIIVGDQQQIRVDDESILNLSLMIESAIIKTIEKEIADSDAVIIADYQKGCVTKKIASVILRNAKKLNIPVVTDPKPSSINLYRGATVIKPNATEAQEITGLKNIKKASREISKRYCCSVVLSEGSAGMTLCHDDQIEQFEALNKRAVDVVGAGDTVVALLALSLAVGASLHLAVVLASMCASVVVGKQGTAVCSEKELIAMLVPH